MKTLLERRFVVPRTVEDVFAHLADVEAWPTWARHIKKARLDPTGPLTAQSTGVFKLAGGIPTRFRMVRFDPPRSWLWTGRFLWLKVDYDHVFRALDEGCEVTFRVDVGGLGTNTLGRLFARIYRGNLDKAIPNLMAQLGT